MKRTGRLFANVVSFRNLLLASEKTLQGHRHKPSAAQLEFHLERELLELQRELEAETWRPRPYRTFLIREPKVRHICAADIRDRVVHHAICNLLEPILERRMISDSFACRKGKGTHAAVRKAAALAWRHRFFMKLDVRHFFATVDHAVLQAMLRRILKDAKLLRLLDRIIEHSPPFDQPGRGLPIGNLTSQHFANLYLDELDHFVKERLRVKAYIRYMDDLLLFGHSKQDLYRLLATIRLNLQAVLKLELKEESILVEPSGHGIPFLGFRIFPGTVRLARCKWVRFRRKVGRREFEFFSGNIDEEGLSRSVTSMIGHVRHADSLAARRSFFERSLSLG